VRIVEAARESAATPHGGVQSRQTAEITLQRRELDRLWSPEYLERLARTYWLYLSRVSLGLLRVIYTRDSRSVVLLTRRLALLRFRAPEYEMEPRRGVVTWRIDRGLLVAREGRGRGFLRIAVERPPESLEPGSPDDDITARVTAEVQNFYPTIAVPGARGLLGRIMRAFYRATQSRLHVLVTHGFLRSLSRLELPRSAVGAFTGWPPATAPPVAEGEDPATAGAEPGSGPSPSARP
jgi:hypothetical protein